MRVGSGFEEPSSARLAKLRSPRESLSSAEVADFASLLSVASRVLIATLACDRRPATLLRLTLKDLGFPVRMLAKPLEFTIDRCDTVVVFAGPNLNHDDICLVRAAIDSEAVLLAITTSRPPAPLDQADAAIRVRATTSRGESGRPAAIVRSTLDLTALTAVGEVHVRLTQLLRSRRGRS